MPPISREYMYDFGQTTLNKLGKKGESFTKLTEKYPNRLAVSIFAECAVHLGATEKTVADLVQELMFWAAAYERREKHDEKTTREQITQTQWDLAVAGLQRCAELAESDQREKLLELAYSIAGSIADLAGLGTVKTLFEIADKYRDDSARLG